MFVGEEGGRELCWLRESREGVVFWGGRDKRVPCVEGGGMGVGVRGIKFWFFFSSKTCLP